MPDTNPTADEIQARFPEFAPVSDTLIDMVVAESATTAVGSTWCEADRKLGKMLFTAHTLTLEGEPARTNAAAAVAAGEADPATIAGKVQSAKIGEVAVTFEKSTDKPASATSTSGGSENELRRTTYGARYLTLLRKNTAGARAL